MDLPQDLARPRCEPGRGPARGDGAGAGDGPRDRPRSGRGAEPQTGQANNEKKQPMQRLPGCFDTEVLNVYGSVYVYIDMYI